MKNAEVSEVTLFLVPRNAASYVNTVGFPHKPDLLKTGTVVKDWGQTDTVTRFATANGPDLLYWRRTHNFQIASEGVHYSRLVLHALYVIGKSRFT